MSKEEDGEDEKKKGGGLMKIILLAVGGLVLLGAGFAGGFFMFGMNSPTPEQQVEEIIERKLKESGQIAAEAPAEGEAGAEGEGEAAADAGPTRKTKPTDVPETYLTSYYEFSGNFTTNLLNSRKFLQVGLGISTQYDESVITNVETHQLALRSEVLGIIGEFGEEDIQGKEGRDALAVRMRDAINAKLEELEGFGGVEAVHFTSFVLQ